MRPLPRCLRRRSPRRPARERALAARHFDESGLVTESARSAISRSLRRGKRWLLLVLGVLVGTALVAAVLWYGWFPNYRPRLGSDEAYGLDVSNHQGEIDWHAVAADDIRFAYVKATEGGDFVDKRFEQNWENARAAGIARGAYHFFTLCRPGVDQARNFLRVVDLRDADLPPALDLELGGNCRERPTAEEVEAEVTAFVDIVEAETGRQVVLYVLGNWEELYPVPDDKSSRPRWIRRLVLRPSGQWYIWQFSGAAKVSGVTGGVDLNVMRTGRDTP